MIDRRVGSYLIWHTNGSGAAKIRKLLVHKLWGCLARCPKPQIPIALILALILALI